MKYAPPPIRCHRTLRPRTSVETEQAKIYHHHTPRQYLLPWADSDERVAWYGYGKVMRSGLTVVGGEDNFYKLKELTVPGSAVAWRVMRLAGLRTEALKLITEILSGKLPDLRLPESLLQGQRKPPCATTSSACSWSEGLKARDNLSPRFDFPLRSKRRIDQQSRRTGKPYD